MAHLVGTGTHQKKRGITRNVRATGANLQWQPPTSDGRVVRPSHERKGRISTDPPFSSLPCPLFPCRAVARLVIMWQSVDFSRQAFDCAGDETREARMATFQT